MKLLFFSASWCTAGNAIKDTLPEYTYQIDCEEDQETPTKYNVESLPIFIATTDSDEEVARLITTNVKLVDRWFRGLHS